MNYLFVIYKNIPYLIFLKEMLLNNRNKYSII